MPNFGPTELIIILIIAVLLFGVGRLGRLGGELGKGIKEFRKGIQDDDTDEEGASDETSNEASDEVSEEPPWEPDN